MHLAPFAMRTEIFVPFTVATDTATQKAPSFLVILPPATCLASLLFQLAKPS